VDEDADAPGGAGAAAASGCRDGSLARAITTAYHAVGNAVPPPLGASLACEIINDYLGLR
jgi:hypothetical protein